MISGDNQARTLAVWDCWAILKFQGSSFLLGSVIVQSEMFRSDQVYAFVHISYTYHFKPYPLNVE